MNEWLAPKAKTVRPSAIVSASRAAAALMLSICSARSLASPASQASRYASADMVALSFSVSLAVELLAHLPVELRALGAVEAEEETRLQAAREQLLNHPRVDHPAGRDGGDARHR